MSGLNEKWSHRWLSSKTEIHHSSIHGLGVFATEGINKGEPVAVLGGIIVPVSEIKEYWKIMGFVGIQFDDNFFIVPSEHSELEMKGAFNHSCDPNLGLGNSITLVSMRDIQQGEELVLDYAFCETYDDGEVMECHCGSAKCRKRIRPTDWQLPELRKKYGEYYSPYLRNKL